MTNVYNKAEKGNTHLSLAPLSHSHHRFNS